MKPEVRMTLKGFWGNESPMFGVVLVVGPASRDRGVPSSTSQATQQSQLGEAASNDGKVVTAGGDALSAAAAAGRETNAEVADSMAKKTKGTPPKNDLESTEALWDQRVHLKGGPELPKDGWEFLQALNKKIDAVELMNLLLRSRDEKLSGRLLEQVLEMAYEKTEREAEENEAPEWNIPRPVRD